MPGFQDRDRPFLMLAFEKAKEAARPPVKPGNRPEPAWAALVVANEREVVASASFSSGDGEDAVKKLLPQFQHLTHPEASLYLTLEPKASFNRLPPVTESVRHLGVKRVVIGTLDPAQRYRGEGQRTLEQMGIEVVLADGEEALCCQQLLDDYAKWLQKGLCVLRAQVELSGVPGGNFDITFADESSTLRTDALICRAGGPRPLTGDTWRVVIDAEGWERPAERTILYQTAPPVPGPGVRLLPMREGQPDLGAVLRDLGSIGFLSAELSGDAELFRLALRSGLIDSVTANLTENGDSVRTLSQFERVRLREGGGVPMDIKLNGARLIDGHLEANIELG